MRDECIFLKSLRQKIKKRDGYHCILCGGKSDLTIAHIFKWKQDGGLGIELNGLTLCRPCHDKLDFGINCTKEEQIYMLKVCKMYLTLFYNREITDEDVTSKQFKIGRNDKR